MNYLIITQSTYNVTLRRVGANVTTVEKHYILHILNVFCSLRYPADNTHAPYCHLWPVRLYNIFTNYPINGIIFEKQVLLT